MKTISVIVPVYNVEVYLPQCIDSIVNQTYRDLEIILVDDGSPDNCPQICDSYAQKDNRIRVIHKKNGGLSSARNAGLDIATGEYVSFVDSDDWVEPGMYESLLKLSIEKSVDIAVCDIYTINNKNDKSTYSKDNNKVTLYFSMNDFFFHLVRPDPLLRFEVWNKLYKKEVIGNTRFINGQIYEDMYFDRMLFSKVHSVAHIATPFYVYRQSRFGNINSFFKENRFVFFEEVDNYLTFFSKKYVNPNLELLYAIFGLDNCITFFVDANNLDAKKEYKDRLILLFRDYFAKYGLMISKSNRRLFKYCLFKYFPYLYYYMAKCIKR